MGFNTSPQENLSKSNYNVYGLWKELQPLLAQQSSYMYGVQQKLMIQLVELQQENNRLLQLVADKLDIIEHLATK